MITLAGVSASVSSSKIASRRIRRSMTAMRSIRQFFRCAGDQLVDLADAADGAGDQGVGEGAPHVVDHHLGDGVGVLVLG